MKKLTPLNEEEFEIKRGDKHMPGMAYVYAKKNKLVVWAVPESWTDQQIDSAISLARTWYMLGKSERFSTEDQKIRDLMDLIRESCDNK